MTIRPTDTTHGVRTYKIVAVSPSEIKSSLPSIVRKITDRHNGLYRLIDIEKQTMNEEGEVTSTILCRIQVRVTSSGKDTMTKKMQELFRNSIRLEAPKRNNESNNPVYHLDPKSLKKKLLAADNLLDVEERKHLNRALITNRDNLSDLLNSLSNGGEKWVPTSTSPCEGPSADDLATQATQSLLLATNDFDYDDFDFDDYVPFQFVSGSQGASRPPHTISLDEFLHDIKIEKDSYKIGEGGYGSVFRGNYQGKLVAIKELLDPEPIDLTRLSGEGLGLCLSKEKIGDHFVKVHFIIVDIYSEEKELVDRRAIGTEGDFYRLPPHSFIVATVSDFAGGTLEAGCKTPEQVVRLGCQAAQALAALHDQNVIHHDFKEENCVVDSTGKLRLIDPGLSIYLKKRGRAQSNGGTLGYLAPEIGKNLPVDHKIDSWALGVTLLRLSTGNFLEAEIRALHFQKRIEEEGLERLRADPKANTKKEEINTKKGRIEALEDILRTPQLLLSTILFKSVPKSWTYRDQLIRVLTGLIEQDPKRRMSAKEAAKRLAVIERNLNSSETQLASSGGGGGGRDDGK